jgi:hypothetical protein
MLTTQALTSYMSDWENAFGKNKQVPLPAGCTNGSYCPDYGPLLDYKTMNKDRALGGNLPFSNYANPKEHHASKRWRSGLEGHCGFEGRRDYQNPGALDVVGCSHACQPFLQKKESV